MKKITFLDVETTGLDPLTDQIVSYFAMQWSLVDGVPVHGRSLFSYVLPTCPVNPEAAKINGYDEARWLASGARPWDQQHSGQLWGLLQESVDYAGKPVVGGHGVNFDVRFFEESFKRVGYTFPVSHRRVDTHALCAPLVTLGQIRSASLTDVSVYFGINTSGAHDAVHDVHACVAVWEKVLGMYAGVLGL